MLFWMTSIATAGDLEVTVAYGDDEMTALLTGVAPCRAHEVTLSGVDGVWEIRLRPEQQEGGVLITTHVERHSEDEWMELEPTLLLADGAVGEVCVGDAWMEIIATGFEDASCPTVSSTRRRVDRTSRTRTTEWPQERDQAQREAGDAGPEQH